ncbi:MAG: SPFH domain-containing protein [Pirellulales bacterium]
MNDDTPPLAFPSVPRRRRGLPALIGTALVTLVVLAIGATAFHWTVNRIYVEPGESLLLIYKGPLLFGSRETARAGHFAEVDAQGRPQQVGVLAELRGPGRHFYCPIWWKVQRVRDVIVKPRYVGIVTSKLGDELPSGEFLVDGDVGSTTHKGVLRKVLTSGCYRINTYAYDVEIKELEIVKDGNQEKRSGWVNIRTGYVGVVTNLAPNPLTGAKAGIQDKVLQPGIYPVNPKEQQIDVVEVGFREKSVAVKLKLDAQGDLVFDKSGEPQIAVDPGGISFPSNDGFTIYMDFTAVWGVMPDQAAAAVKKFGNIQAVEEKVVGPQIESICRNMGSQFAAVELLVGDTRQKFQIDTSRAFGKALHEKQITLQKGLVRYIYIPQEVRTPIQTGYIADELKLTRDQDQLTARTEANLREAERKVELESERVIVETEKMVAKVAAEGQKKAEETRAKTVQLVAAIDRETATLEAEATVLLGEADATSQKMLAEARADKFALAVDAFGSGEAYNGWVFASGLPDDLKLRLVYAGEGTFWTDLKGMSETLLGRQVDTERRAKKP